MTKQSTQSVIASREATRQSNKLKILHILDHSIPLQSGYTFRTRNILRQQRLLGWETVHVTSIKHKGAEAIEETIDGLHFYRTLTNGIFGRLPVFNQLQVIQTLARRIGEIIEKEQPNIIHAHSPALNGLAALKAGKQYELPVVYECRAFWEDAAVDHGTSREYGLRYRLTHALESRVFRQADAVTTICEGLKKDIIVRGIPESKITVIPNAVDVEHFKITEEENPALKEKLGLQGKVVLGFIGSFYAYEGLPLLLEAMPQMLADNPDLRLLLVGGGPQEEQLKKKVAELGLENSVIMTGRVPHNEVQDYYNLVDIFVYPRFSMRLTELVTPLKPLEAMAHGKLVVASDVGGHQELIRHGVTGILFKANCKESLANATLQLLKMREQWPAMRVAGRAFVEQERNWRNSVIRYQGIYEKLCP